MPADIFISYSRHDSPQALELADRLRSNGMSVWIDQHGLDGAVSWSREIAEAMEECSAVLLLLTDEAQQSRNVAKELSVATELRKEILPLELGTVTLRGEFLYHLSGIQRTRLSDFDAILRSLTKLGVSGENGKQRTDFSPADSRKSLMVLPFEDHSPSNDNQWFADGLMSELISSLSNIKTLRLIDEKTSRSMRNATATTIEIAKDYSVRYFLQGSVRKFGEQIKISMSLIDIKTGQHLWTDSHKGDFSDIFTMQEEAARKVVDALKIHLSSDEVKKLSEKGTENAEAYELYLRAQELIERRTRDDRKHALALLSEAIAIDAHFSAAYTMKAFVLSELFRMYEKDQALLAEAEILALRACELRPDRYVGLYTLSSVYMLQRRFLLAEETAKRYIALAPQDWKSHFALGYYYFHAGEFDLAVAPYKEVLRLRPEERVAGWNLLDVLERLGLKEEQHEVAIRILPQYERWLKFHPEDHHSRIQYAIINEFAGQSEAAIATLEPLTKIKDLDGGVLYNMYALYAQLDKPQLAFDVLKRSVEAGFHALELLRAEPSFGPLSQLPEFQEWLKKLELEAG